MTTMYRKISVILLLAVMLAGVSAIHPQRAGAAALQIRPLEYHETVQGSDSKKGFVDVANAASTPVVVTTEVRGFRQIDDKGNLQFFNSTTISEGIVLDLKEVELGPREAVRIYFKIDAARLPKGDVFAAIFATTKSAAGTGIMPSAEVGTLLILQNGLPGPRRVTVESLHVPVFQFSSAVSGTATLHNPASDRVVSGFFPHARVSLKPLAGTTKDITGPLVMAGRSRIVSFRLPDSRIGIYQLTVTAGNSRASTWLLVITGYWRWASGIMAGAIIVGISVIIITNKRRTNRTLETISETPKSR